MTSVRLNLFGRLREVDRATVKIWGTGIAIGERGEKWRHLIFPARFAFDFLLQCLTL